jgi:hypothetical protein
MYTNFLKNLPPAAAATPFSSKDIAAFSDILPQKTVDFLVEYGQTRFGDNFYTICNPLTFRKFYKAWDVLDSDDCWAIMYNAFGNFLYYNRYEEQFHYISGILGHDYRLGKDFENVLDEWLAAAFQDDDGIGNRGDFYLKIPIEKRQKLAINAAFSVSLDTFFVANFDFKTLKTKHIDQQIAFQGEEYGGALYWDYFDNEED